MAIWWTPQTYWEQISSEAVGKTEPDSLDHDVIASSAGAAGGVGPRMRCHLVLVTSQRVRVFGKDLNAARKKERRGWEVGESELSGRRGCAGCPGGQNADLSVGCSYKVERVNSRMVVGPQIVKA